MNKVSAVGPEVLHHLPVRGVRFAEQKDTTRVHPVSRQGSKEGCRRSKKVLESHQSAHGSAKSTEPRLEAMQEGKIRAKGSCFPAFIVSA
jgi:hypothetical protein